MDIPKIIEVGHMLLFTTITDIPAGVAGKLVFDITIGGLTTRSNSLNRIMFDVRSFFIV